MRKVSPLSRDEADVYGRRSPRLLPRTIVRSGSEDRGDEKSSREMESWPPDHVGWGYKQRAEYAERESESGTQFGLGILLERTLTAADSAPVFGASV